MLYSRTEDGKKGKHIESPANIEIKRIRELMFQFLDGVENVHQVRTKELRSFLERSLSFPPGTFKSSHYKFIFDVFLTQYSLKNELIMTSNPLFIEAESQDPNTDGELQFLKKGKFSNAEKNIIRQTLSYYAEENGVDVKEFHPNYREDKSGPILNGLFDRLMIFLPYRTRNVSLPFFFSFNNSLIYRLFTHKQCD